GAKKREPNKKTNILSREFFSNVAIIIIVSGQKLIFQSALYSFSLSFLFRPHGPCPAEEQEGGKIIKNKDKEER
ncbi:MAG: hypothetical protein LBC18_10875, partial [Opitutaceae bacterium]|nr:hypothetical protein [Opitutaceae bacterium]